MSRLQNSGTVVVALWVAALSSVAGDALAAGSCDLAGADGLRIVAARNEIAATCDCAGAVSHGAYVRCANAIFKARIEGGLLSMACRNVARRCVQHSTCGRGGAVTCCRTNAGGNTSCSIKRDAAHCQMPNGGSACVGTATSCCDACGATGCALPPTPTPTPSPGPTPTSCGGTCAGGIQRVFVIVMENRNWVNVKGNPAAPYINSLLSVGAYAEQYFNPPGNHPSEPNYLWLEGGTSFHVTNDAGPSINHQSSTAHLVTLLDNAGISWRSYQEGISGTVCPLDSVGNYAPKHNPMIFFEDVTEYNNLLSPKCIAHMRPYSELAADLQNGTTARYNFITPDLCNDMHDSCPPLSNPLVQGDTWLAAELPQILGSVAYQNNGVVFVTWDEGVGASNGPIGMIVLSPLAKPGGYSNSIHYTHSSTLRTLEEIFGVAPMLGDAANATDLADLFATFP